MAQELVCMLSTNFAWIQKVYTLIENTNSAAPGAYEPHEVGEAQGGSTKVIMCRSMSCPIQK